MKGLPLIFLASFMVMTGSCSKADDEGIELKQNVKQILFFSDDTDYSEEAAYYDALIELKENFPKEIKNMLVLSPTNAKQYFKAYQIKACPALLVVYNETVVVKITGNVSKDEIIHPISEVLSNDLAIKK
ncbi:small peptidoglycan-associated lipoprotein [Neobacillus sp. LXY-4]|uniref:small peptidoglycan-associated lipoprotein n=1 Tax=Neobacillus sp. LXY-4 TaxID=3379826 RepID=UPI003EE0ECC7